MLDLNFGILQPLEAVLLDEFIACFEGLIDPRIGDAGLHECNELLVIALQKLLFQR